MKKIREIFVKKKREIFAPMVLSINSEKELLTINMGRDDLFLDCHRFMVYSIGEEIFDPDTKESLGRLEIVKGRYKAVSVGRLSTTIKRFDNEETPQVEVGDFVRFI